MVKSTKTTAVFLICSYLIGAWTTSACRSGGGKTSENKEKSEPQVPPKTLCIIPQLSSGRLSIIDYLGNDVRLLSSNETIDVGTFVRLECDSGFQASGNDSPSCVEGGVEEVPQSRKCNHIECCTPLPDISNGTVEVKSERKTFRTIWQLRCIYSYIAENVEYLLCGKNGTLAKPASCRGISCSTSPLKCKNGKSVPQWLVCNGVDDCGDSSDEVNCRGRYDTGFVYYPPYGDPYKRKEECKYTEWELEPGEFTPFEYIRNSAYRLNHCRGKVHKIPFLAPKSYPDYLGAQLGTRGEVMDNYTISWGIADHPQYKFVFTCLDRSGQVKPGLYFWGTSAKGSDYWYRGMHFYYKSLQPVITWNGYGKMLYKPVRSPPIYNGKFLVKPSEYDPTYVSCYYYDKTKGYLVPVRTWLVTRGTESNNDVEYKSDSVKLYICPTGFFSNMSNNTDIEVVVTSRHLMFRQFCPIVSCVDRPPSEFIPFTYSPSDPRCVRDATDPTYPLCNLNPVEHEDLSYQCKSPSQEDDSGKVTIRLKYGARFSHYRDFRVNHLKEDDRDVELPCRVVPETSDSAPIWKFLHPKHKYIRYLPISSNLIVSKPDVASGNHKLVLKTVKPELEGSYRCRIDQSQRVVPGALPIYGYHFVKVYGKPRCSHWRYNLMLPKWVAFNSTLPVLRGPVVKLLCYELAQECAWAQCGPVVVLRKNSVICAMSNSTKNWCDGMQSVTAWVEFPGLFFVNLVSRKNLLTVPDQYPAFYTVQFVYDVPGEISFDLPAIISL